MSKVVPVGQKLSYLFAIIVGVAALATSYVFGSSVEIFSENRTRLILAIFIVVFPLAIESVGTLGLLLHWFRGIIRPGLVINILQWIAGFFGIAAIFDGIMRLMRKSEWMLSGPTPLVTDAILLILFILWMAVSHIIHKDSKERGVCEYC